MSRRFSIGYRLQGRQYSVNIDAADWEDAERHLAALHFTGQITGEVVAEIAAPDRLDIGVLMRLAMAAAIIVAAIRLGLAWLGGGDA